MMKKILILVMVGALAVKSYGCTIFFLTDKDQSLFFSNEDYNNPNTNMWFRLGSADYYGAVYVGFTNAEPQGGMNTEGLSYDYWADAYHPYEMDRSKPMALGISAERMLESCKNVAEAIAFYKKYTEPGFSSATIFIADKTGASVIIHVEDSQLVFSESNESRGWGAAEKTFNKMYHEDSNVNLINGTEIMRNCTATGAYATKYSTIYNLRNGDIELHQFHRDVEPVKLNLFTELQKGAHIYTIPNINAEILEEPIALPINFERLILFENSPLKHTKTSKKYKTMIGDLSTGIIKEDDYEKGVWVDTEKEGEEIKQMLQPYGEVENVKFLKKECTDQIYNYYVLTIYKKGRILWRFRHAEGQEEVKDIRIGAATKTSL